jgi:hypothetical protein
VKWVNPGQRARVEPAARWRHSGAERTEQGILAWGSRTRSDQADTQSKRPRRTSPRQAASCALTEQNFQARALPPTKSGKRQSASWTAHWAGQHHGDPRPVTTNGSGAGTSAGILGPPSRRAPGRSPTSGAPSSMKDRGPYQLAARAGGYGSRSAPVSSCRRLPSSVACPSERGGVLGSEACVAVAVASSVRLATRNFA